MSSDFRIPVRGDIAAKLERARSEILKHGGQLHGDQNAGSFSGPSPIGPIEGNYTVTAGEMVIRLTRKPFLFPSALAEAKLKEYFGAD